MRRATPLLTLLTVALALIPAQAVEGQVRRDRPRFDLAPKFTEGQEVWFTLDQRIDLSMASPQMPDASKRQNTEQSLLLKLDVLEVGEQETRATMTIERMRMTAPLDGGITFDSAAPQQDPDNPLAAVMSAFVGHKIELTIDDAGEITSVGGLEGMLPSGPVGQMMSSHFSPDVLKRRFSNVTSSRIERKTRIGSRWTTNDAIPLSTGGKVVVNTTHRLRKVENDVARVEMSGDVTIDTGTKSPLAALEMRSSSVRGDYDWNIEEGMLDRFALERRVEFEATRQGISMFLIEEVSTRVARVPAPPEAKTTDAR